MPKVGKKTFSYTKKGELTAKLMAKKTGKKLVKKKPMSSSDGVYMGKQINNLRKSLLLGWLFRLAEMDFQRFPLSATANNQATGYFLFISAKVPHFIGLKGSKKL